MKNSDINGLTGAIPVTTCTGNLICIPIMYGY
jgi:hypothetical protein